MRAGLVAGVVALSLLGAAWTARADSLSADSLMRDVQTYAALAPDHLTGTTDSGATQQWLSAQLDAAGVPTQSDAYRFFRFIPRRVRLTLDGLAVPSVIARFYSGTTPAGGITAPRTWMGVATH